MISKWSPNNPRLWTSERRQDPGLVAHRDFALRKQSQSHRTTPGLYGQRPAPAPKRPMEGHTKMSKRGVEMLRTAFFHSAFSAAHNDPELRAYYQRKRAQGKTHQVALTHLMRILTRRLVAVLRSGKPYQSHYNLKNAA